MRTLDAKRKGCCPLLHCAQCKDITAHPVQVRSIPVEQATSRLAIKKRHREAHDLGQQIGMQPAGGVEGAQHQQQCPATLHKQGHQTQGEVEGHVLAAVDVQAFLLQPGGLI